MRHLLISLIAFCSVLSIKAQTGDPKDAYAQFKRQAEAKYSNFRDEANARYAEFMEEAWEWFEAMPAIPRPKDQDVKPRTLPDEDRDKPVKNKPIRLDTVMSPPRPAPPPRPADPIEEQPVENNFFVECSFYNTPIKVRFPEDDILQLGDCGNKKLRKAWLQLSDSQYDNTIYDCLHLRDSLQLCDYAYLQMVDTIAHGRCPSDNEATLLAAFLYCQSGYKMRIGRVHGKICLLTASRHQIFDNKYWEIDGERFYALDCDADRLEILNVAFPSEQPLSLLITEAPLFAYDASTERTLQAKHYADMGTTTRVNKNLLAFYASYPTSCVDYNFMTRWAMYANTPLDPSLKAQLYPTLTEAIAGLSQLDAANKLLDYVQTAFVYALDDEIWGHDRAFFSEETLYYPFCDCEDRSIFFSRLVRDLLHLDVVLVYYPGHLATAVAFTDNVEGDFITLDGTRFTIADPTYIDAPIGRTMTKMDNATATVILLE